VADAGPSDATLLERMRDGDAGALAELWNRHHAAATRFAEQSGADPHLAGDVVGEAFEAMVRAIRNGAGPEHNVRAYLFLAVRRRLARSARRQERVVHLEDGAEPAVEVGDPVVDRLEREAALAAFERLSERDRAVLHYLELEGMTPAEAAPLLGASPNALSQANVRAKRSLRASYLQVHAERAARGARAACRPFIDRMGAYRAGKLSARDTAALEAHLEGCEHCRRIAGFVQDEARGMRLLVWPMLFGPGLAGYLATSHDQGTAVAVGGAAVVTGAAGAAAAAGGSSGASAASAASAGAGGVVGNGAVRVGRPRGLKAASHAKAVGAAAGAAAAVVAVAALVAALSGDGDRAPREEPRADGARPPVATTVAPVASTATTTAVDDEPRGPAPAVAGPRSTTGATTPTTVAGPGTPPSTGALPTTVPTTAPSPPTSPPSTAPGAPAASPPLTLGLGRLGTAAPGGPLTITLRAANAGPTPTAAAAWELGLPEGATLAAGGAPGCTATPTAAPVSVQCPLPALAAGASTSRTATVVLGDADTATFTLAVPGTAARTTLTVGTVPSVLTPVFADVLRGDVAVAGASLITCAPADPGCAAALADPRDPAASTRARQLAWVDTDDDPTTRASAAADVAFAGTVRHATLLWAGEVAPPGATPAREGAIGSVVVGSPSGSSHAVAADQVVLAGTRYVAHADVTALLAAGGPGVWTVGGVEAALGPGTSAGWALAVVTEDPAAPARSVVVHAGLADAYPGRPAGLVAHVPAPAGPARLWAAVLDGGRDAEGGLHVGDHAVTDPWPSAAPGSGLGFGFDVAELDVSGGVRAAPAVTPVAFVPSADRHQVGLVVLAADTDEAAL